MTQSPPPGTLRLVRGPANPDGAPGTELFLLQGDVTSGPVKQVLPDPGVILPGPPALSGNRPFRLHIVHFSDLHHNLAEVTSEGSQPIFSRIAGRIRELRQRCAADPAVAVLVLSAGDDLVGTAFDDLLIAEPSSAVVHATYRVYSSAGVDAAAIGNHDLDLGLETLLAAARRDARFPLLSANLVVREACAAGDGATAGIYPAALVVSRGVRVGLLGLTTPAEIKHCEPRDFDIADPVQAARNLIPALRSLCDVLIVLSHLGYSLDSPSALTAAAGDVELARSLSHGAVDLIVGGHTHTALNEEALGAENVVNGIPIVGTGSGGRYLGEVHMTVRQGRGTVTDARLLPVADLPIDQAFEAQHVQPLADRVRAILQQPIGRAADHPDLSATSVREAFAREESALANFIADALVEQCRAAGYPADFALVDASSVPTGLPAGKTLTYADLFRLMPHADSIFWRRITPAQLQELLDDNARRADRPDEPHAERGFLHFSREVRYRIVLGPSRSEAHATAITWARVPLEALIGQRGEPFLVVCSSFVRSLANCWERSADAEGLRLFDLRALPCGDTGLLMRRELLAFMRGHGGATEEAGARRDGRVTFG